MHPPTCTSGVASSSVMSTAWRLWSIACRGDGDGGKGQGAGGEGEKEA